MTSNEPLSSLARPVDITISSKVFGGDPTNKLSEIGANLTLSCKVFEKWPTNTPSRKTIYSLVSRLRVELSSMTVSNFDWLNEKKVWWAKPDNIFEG